ncbi:hypothetical protein LWI29_008594 [Acer saccharum]|uniref:Uncharacterized protein n=1 Tax=Acer saccharum TaxID=4024 RepID=A0AA39TCY9_ACESA|nr:hypothetical protein LWI29_008594 [Acer saccharum]KAK1589546.1 hypothetical protein Q3G72_035153 [Acer saccharum]
MEGSTGITGIDRKPSIETEPRTLSIDQIHNAREEALNVMRTSSIEQATTIFTQGLQAVDSCGVKRQKDTLMDDDLGEEELLLKNSKDEQQVPELMRDVATAPF